MSHQSDARVRVIDTLRAEMPPVAEEEALRRVRASAIGRHQARRASVLSRHPWRVVGVMAAAAAVFAGVAFSFTPRANITAEPTQPNATEINAPNVPDFREWCTKKSSLAEAEKSLGAKVRAPTETRGRNLKAIYVGETYPDGSAVDTWDKEALLDYGDFVVLIAPRPSAQAAASHVEEAGNPLNLATGLYRRCTVRGTPAYVRKKGEVTAEVDSSGKTVRPAMTSTESVVYFSAGNEAVLVFSEPLSEDDVLAIAESIDFD